MIKKVRDQIILHIGVAESQSEKPDQQATRAIRFLDSIADVESTVAGDGYIVATLKKEVEDYSEIRSQLIREEEVDLESAFMPLTKGTRTNF